MGRRFVPLLPTKVHHRAAGLLKGGVFKVLPAWLPAVNLHPPGPTLLRTTYQGDVIGDSSESGAAASVDLSETYGGASAYAVAADNASPTVRSHAHKHLRQRHARPQKIVYPEDRMRRRFYRDHPFELLRPRVLIDNNEDTSVRQRTWDWSRLADGLDERPPGEITGESVIQYQLFLMRSRGMPERQAYVKACSWFHAIRARQEVEQQVAEEQARAFSATRVHTEMEKAIAKERYFLNKGVMRNVGEVVGAMSTPNASVLGSTISRNQASEFAWVVSASSNREQPPRNREFAWSENAPSNREQPPRDREVAWTESAPSNREQPPRDRESNDQEEGGLV